MTTPEPTPPLTDDELAKIREFVERGVYSGAMGGTMFDWIELLLAENAKLTTQLHNSRQCAVRELEAQVRGDEAEEERDALAARIEAARTAFEVENRPVFDFPTGFEVMGETNTDNHHPKCSQCAGMLCDCAGIAGAAIAWVKAWSRAADAVAHALDPTEDDRRRWESASTPPEGDTDE